MVITNNPLIKSDMISVPVLTGSTQTKLPFPDQPQLRSTFLQSIYMPLIDIDIFGQPTLNNNVAKEKGFLVLYFDGRENVQQIPLIELMSDQRTANKYNVNGILGFNSQLVIWPKSYILLSSAIAPGSDVVFTFAVNYSLTKI
jgi:hypothetical protein